MKICDYQEFLHNQFKFTPQEINSYLSHANKSIEVISHFSEIPPGVIQILLEQNEMPNGEGFPRKLNAHQINQLSCLFILSGIFAKHLLRDEENFNLPTFVKYLDHKKYSEGNFQDAFLAIKGMN
jgi:response regulator RpfG family c-di-GMP phosphodiesterase